MSEWMNESINKKQISERMNEWLIEKQRNEQTYKVWLTYHIWNAVTAHFSNQLRGFKDSFHTRSHEGGGKQLEDDWGWGQASKCERYDWQFLKKWPFSENVLKNWDIHVFWVKNAYRHELRHKCQQINWINHKNPKKFFFNFLTPSDPETYPCRDQYLGL